MNYHRNVVAECLKTNRGSLVCAMHCTVWYGYSTLTSNLLRLSMELSKALKYIHIHVRIHVHIIITHDLDGANTVESNYPFTSHVTARHNGPEWASHHSWYAYTLCSIQWPLAPASYVLRPLNHASTLYTIYFVLNIVATCARCSWPCCRVSRHS